MGVFDDSRIDIACPKCNKKRSERIGDLQKNPQLVCSGCGARIDIKADELRKSLKQVDDSVANLRNALGKFGKR